MVKFASSKDAGYIKVLGHLWLLAKEAPDAISLRWAEQGKSKNSMRPHPGVTQYIYLFLY